MFCEKAKADSKACKVDLGGNLSMYRRVHVVLSL